MGRRYKLLTVVVCFLFSGAVMLQMTGCTAKIQAADLMDGVEPGGAVGSRTPDDLFTQAYADFTVRLFQESADTGKNSLISPLSVMLALAMTANGADGQTKAEMEAILGGGIPLAELNEYLHAFSANLLSNELKQIKIANSIWFREQDGLDIKSEFLQKNADYYDAAAYKSVFDKQTLKDINNWVEQNTDGMIDQILEEIDPNTVMYLINALVFHANWAEKYYKNDIFDGHFTAYDGTQRGVEMMCSTEMQYINSGNATGFAKSYQNNRYYFAALLPNEGVSIQDYIASLSGGGLLSALGAMEQSAVAVKLPKFSYDYSVSMNQALKNLGMPTAFSAKDADFSKLGTSSAGNIYIGDVLHKTYISVDELGTKAGAVTKVEMKNESALDEYSVCLDRPFVYAIVDSATNLPIFIGAALDIGK